MSDLGQVLGLQTSTPAVTDTLDDAFRSHRGSQARTAPGAPAGRKKAKGLSREVYNLLGADALPPMVLSAVISHSIIIFVDVAACRPCAVVDSGAHSYLVPRLSLLASLRP